MNFYVDSGGVVLHVDPERIFQGSANANTIRFVGAFASNLSVTTAFKLPNGVWTVPQKMTLSAQLPGVQMPDGTQFNTWEYKIPATVTENYGAVNVQFFVYGDTGGTGGQIASAMSSFEVEKGVPITLPDPTDDYNTLLTQILSALSQLQGFYDGLNTEVEELQTSVRGLQGEVSGIQIDLEQVHTELGNRVEKTTLTYSLYGTDKNGNQAIIPYGTTGLGNSIPQYTADSEIRIPTSPTQSYYAANKGYVDAGLEEKLDKTGGPINGDLLVGGELRVLDNTIIIGNLTVQGTTITEDAETIMSKANVIVTNSEGAPLTQLSGIGIRTNATLVYGIMYDPGDDTVKLGEGTLDANNEFTFNSGEGTAVATRADSAMWTNGHLAQWNAAEYRFIDSGIAAGNVVTISTTQQITGRKSFSEPLLSSDSGTSQYTAEYAGTHITEIDEPGAASYTYAFPKKSGIFALTSDIPTDYVTQEEFEKAQRSIEDIYTILGQTVILWQSLTQEYTTRETAAGLDIIDGALTEVKEIRGKTVATENLIPFPYAETTKTQNGVTFTNNGDGTITVNGAATKNTSFFLVFENPTMCLNLRAGENYTLSGCPKGGSDTTFSMYVQDISYTQSIIDYGNGVTKAISYTQYYAFIRIAEGYTANNLVFRPMLNAGTTAKPYSKWFAGLKNASFEKIVSTGRNLFDIVNPSYAAKTENISNYFPKIEDGIFYTAGIIGVVSGVSIYVCVPESKKITLALFNRGEACNYEVVAFNSVDKNGIMVGAEIIKSSSILEIKANAHFSTTVSIPRGKRNIGFSFFSDTRYGGKFTNIQIQFGTTATAYEPYISDTLSAETPIELTEYDVAYPETGETKRQSKTITFNGTETFIIYTPSENNKQEGYTVFVAPLNPKGVSPEQGQNSIVNNYQWKSYGYASAISGTCQSTDSEGRSLFIKQNQFSTMDEWKAHLAELAAAGNPLTVTYQTAEATTEATPFNKSKYVAWDGGSETIYQGTNDNSEYGAENTVVQNYATKRGGTTE